MDRSEQEYKMYSEQMLWWCLPYAIETLPKLASLYHAHGLPHLVVMDTNGKVITKEGVQSLSEDPLGKHFPWRPRRIVDILPQLYLDTDNESFLEMAELDEKYIMLYFAQKSNDLCQDFTPWLVKAYKILKERRPDDFEVRCKRETYVRFCFVFMCFFLLFCVLWHIEILHGLGVCLFVFPFFWGDWWGFLGLRLNGL